MRMRHVLSGPRVARDVLKKAPKYFNQGDGAPRRRARRTHPGLRPCGADPARHDGQGAVCKLENRMALQFVASYFRTRKRRVVTEPESVLLRGSRSTRAGWMDDEKGVPVPSRTGTMCTTISSISTRSRHWPVRSAPNISTFLPSAAFLAVVMASSMSPDRKITAGSRGASGGWWSACDDGAGRRHDFRCLVRGRVFEDPVHAVARPGDEAV